jgi:hypothetical protein
MNPTLEPYIKKLLDGGMKTAEDVASFIEKQTPELGREIITWGAVSESVWPILGLLVIALSVYLHKKLNKKPLYYDNEYGGPPWALVVFCLGLAGTTIFSLTIMNGLYPIIAPRLYILEKISVLIK